MYLDHFQLAVKPFQITSDPKFLWLGEKHKEALATLRYGILDNRGFLLLTGEVGTGKTLLINRLITMLDQDTVVATLPDPDLDALDFYNLLADGFKMNRTFDSKGAFLIHLRDFLYQCHAENKRVLLIVDECQRLSHGLMEDIRILSNIELHDRKLINIFLVGQQEFNAVLSVPQNRAMAQRITVRYHIAPLEKGEIAKYIFHRLRVAGGARKIFTPAAIEQIFNFSGGIPRLINILCDHALLSVYARSAWQVDSTVILECAEELRIPLLPSGSNGSGALRALDSKSIVDAAAMAKHQEQQGAEPSHSNDDKVSQQTNRRSSLQILLYILVTSLLLLIAGFVVTHFSSEEKTFWQSKQQKSDSFSVQQEKALITHQGLVDEGQNAASASAASSETINQRHLDLETDRSPASIKLEALPLMTKEKFIIRFALNSSEIEDESFLMLDRIAGYLVKHPEEHINVRGYTDTSGSPGYNESVSRFRASVVKSYLVGKGVSGEQIATYAMGDAQPVKSNATAEGRHQNRRVEIEFDQGKTSVP